MKRDRLRLNEVIARLGRGHADVGLSEDDVDPDPIEQFERWLEAALEADLILPNAMVLATATPEGRPSARMVLLKGVDERGFIFYTNYESRKAMEIRANPRAALVFHWAELERQVRVTGPVMRVPREESEAYWRTRPRGTQLGAWASRQSEVIPERGLLDDALRAATERFGSDDVPLPSSWGGYVLYPEEIEIWQGRLNRLHDRLLYRRGAKECIVERLCP